MWAGFSKKWHWLSPETMPALEGSSLEPKAMKSSEFSCTAVGNAKLDSYLQNHFVSFCKLKYILTLWASHSTPRCLFKRHANTCSSEDLYRNVHSTLIYNGLKWKHNVHQEVNGYTNWGTVNGITVTNTKEQTTDTTWMKLTNILLSERSQAQEYMLYDST